MPYIRVNGAKIAFDTFGDMDKPAVVLSHGGAAGNEVGRWSWATSNFQQTLAEKYFVVTYDRRCCGQTGYQEPITIQQQAEDVLALIDALCLEKPAVIGLSAGTYVLGRALGLHGADERISKAILIVPNYHGCDGLTPAAAYIKRRGYDIAKLSVQEQLQISLDAMFSPSATPEERMRMMKESGAGAPTVQNPVTKEQVGKAFAEIGTFDNEPYLGQIKVPTLLISGEYDGFCPPEEGKRMSELIPGGEYVLIKDAGHQMLHERPKELIGAVMSFLEK